ncbi:MAG: TonB-dependent receptor [Candidatus Marinimicrobia bacterium]|jgi:iron complex outermembrane receptor protein|nr:TonB-dependent receptor [Candidatus Neomarinimicrobiota bacterium]
MKTYLVLTLLITTIFAETILVSGKVLDENNTPIPGVNIYSRDVGASTDQNGFFMINVPKDAKLTFDHIGFQSVEKSPVEQFILVRMSVDVLQGQDINISATRAIPGITPVAYSSIIPGEIENYYTLQDVPMVLSYEPSVYAWSESGNGTGYSYVSIRGFDQSQIAVMIDNVPMNDNESHQVYWVDHGNILNDAREVQIQRGIGNSLYGAAAFGGSINIQTKIKSDEAKLEATIGHGSYNSSKYSLTYNSGKNFGENSGVNLRLSQIESDGYREYHHSLQQAFSLGIEHSSGQLTSQFRTLIGYENTDLTWDGVYGEDINDRDLRRKGYRGFTDDFLQQVYSLNSRYTVNENSVIRNTLYLVKGSGYYETEKLGKKFYDYNLDSETAWADSTTNLLRRKWIKNNYLGINPSYTIRLNKLRIDLGSEIRIYEGDHFGEVSKLSHSLLADLTTPFKYYQYIGKKSSTTVYIHTIYSLNANLNLFGEIQYVSHQWKMQQDKIGHAVGHSIDADWNFINPRAGLNYRFSDNYSIFGKVGKSEKEPKDDQIINADEWQFEPKGAFPEKITDYEIGFNSSFKKLNALVNLYQINLENEVIENIDFEEEGYYTYSQADKTVHQGIEFEIGYIMNEQIQINWNAAISNNFFDGGDFNQKILPKSPTQLSNLIINYKPESNLSIHSTIKYVGKQFVDNANTDENAVDSYIVWDLGMNYSLGSLLLTGKVNNLMDTLYVTHGEDWGAYWPGATRNYYASLAYRF